MTGSSFHWFVAWRYLMARPRRVSPAIFLVAGTLCIVSAAASFIGNLVFRPEPQRAFVSFGAAELLQCLALLMLAQAGLHVLWGLFRYCRREPGRAGVPCLTMIALVALAIGALTHGALEGAMHSVSTALLVLAIPLLLGVLIRYWRSDRVSAFAVLSSAVILGAAAYGTLGLSRSFFVEDVPFPGHTVLVRGLAAWIVSLIVVEVVVVTQVLRQRASRSALVALLLLAGCALYARNANAPAAASDFSAEAGELAPQAGDPFEAPPMDRHEVPPELPDEAPDEVAADAGEAEGEPETGVEAEGEPETGVEAEGEPELGAEPAELDELPEKLDALLDETPAWAADEDSLESQLLAYAFMLTVGGLGLFGLGLLLGLLGVVLHVMEHLRGHVHQGVRIQQIAVALDTLGLTLTVAGLILQFGSEPFHIFTARSAPQQPFMLVAVALLALGELALILGAIRYGFTFFTTVSVAGVTIGSMALVIVLSVMSGFEIDLRNKILGSNAHVLITKEDGAFTEYRDIAARIGGIPGVVAQTPYLTSEVVIAANSNYANVIIKGVDPDTVGSVTELSKNTQQPHALERLYPLADDGGIAEPPRDAGTGSAPGAGGADTGGEGVDPPPEDMDLDWDRPADFSGGTGAGEDAPASGAAEAAAPLPPDMDMDADADAETGGAADPPPDDMDLGWDSPRDFSGGAGKDASGDVAVAPEQPFLELLDDLGDDDAAGPGEPERWGDSLLDEDDDDTVPELRVSARVARLPGVLVGKELVKNLHLYVGQEVRIISPLAEDTPAGPVPRTRYLRVAGTFFTGMYEYDFKLVYVALSTLQSFLDLQDEVGGIEIRVTDPLETGPVLQDIRAALPPGYRVQDWKEINRNLFSALKLEKIAMFMVLAIIILVASFSIVSNLIMVVVEKAKEIALLKTLGATDTSVVSIFVAQGFFIGLVGMLVGVTHGLVACYLGRVYGLPLDPEVYYIDQLPIHVESLAVAAVAVAGVAISVVATLYPAFMAARLQPMEGLRYD
jgi:lipoprotein-releasing system permease protein